MSSQIQTAPRQHQPGAADMTAAVIFPGGEEGGPHFPSKVPGVAVP
jgi:hypothetical protein